MTAIFITLALLLDLLISSFIFSDFAMTSYVFVPSTTLLFLLFMLLKQSHQKVFVWVLVSGFVVDLMYHTMLFTHVLVFMIVLFILKEYQRHFSDTMIEIVLMGIIAIFLKEIILFSWYTILTVTDVQFLSWYASRLFITMMGNIPIIFIAYHLSVRYNQLLKRQQVKMQKSESTLWGFLRE
jgi:rod shape-determining protein MreD